EKDLADITKKLTEFNSRTQEYKNETNKQIDKIDNIKESLASFNKTEENQSNYLNQLIEEKQNLEAHHKELNDYLLIYDLNKEQTETEMKENEQKVELLNKELKDLNKKLNEINENIEEINNKEEDNLTNQAKLNKQLHQLEIKLKLNDLDKISKEEKTTKEMDQTLKEKERIKEKLTFELNKHRNEVADATVLISDAERELKEEIKKREKISSEIQEEELKVN